MRACSSMKRPRHAPPEDDAHLPAPPAPALF
jgi:hypothetical protein